MSAMAPLSSLLVFLGSGSSTGVPTPSCVTRPSSPPCDVCHKALAEPPERNPNYRCNPSIIIKFLQPDGDFRYIQIDAGKCFREQVLRWFTRYKIPSMDALILTHEHADAILGLDDIRGVQPFDPMNNIPPLPVYLTEHSLESIRTKFPYLVPCKPVEGSSDATVVRRVTQLDYRIIEESLTSPFNVFGLEITPLPVKHGEDYTCLGFLFGSKERVAYISDVSRIPPETERVLKPKPEGDASSALDLLILDSLYKVSTHNTHVSFPESLEIIRNLRPKRALLIGMTHEFDHERDNAELAVWSKREGIPVELSYDGLSIPVEL